MVEADIHTPFIAIVSCEYPHSSSTPRWTSSPSPNTAYQPAFPCKAKPLAKDPLIAHHELAIVMTHCEHDLVEHTLIDPKPCKFDDIVGIDLTLPTV
jgi:hypothetical protein